MLFQTVKSFVVVALGVFTWSIIVDQLQPQLKVNAGEKPADRPDQFCPVHRSSHRFQIPEPQFLSREEKLKNSGFELGDTLPSNWSRDAFVYSDRLFAWVRNQPGSGFGNCSVRIAIPSNEVNDARWIQKVDTTPNTNYYLTGWIKTQSVTDTKEIVNAGANLSILEETPTAGFFTRSEAILGTKNWTRVSLCFNSGSNAQLTVAARLGMFAGQTNGTAWFDNVRLRPVKSCPPKQ